MECKAVAEELLRMKQHDLEVRQRLLDEGKLYNGYSPEMERVHLEHSHRLEEIIAETGYPTICRVGREASNAAWFLIQHSISRPDFMRRMLTLLKKLPPEEMDPRNLLYLEDRIRMYEGKPQLCGTQFEWDDNGRLTPAPYDDLQKVNERRKKAGMPSLEEQTEQFRREQDFFPDPDFLKRHRENYQKWLIDAGWRKQESSTKSKGSESENPHENEL